MSLQKRISNIKVQRSLSYFINEVFFVLFCFSFRFSWEGLFCFFDFGKIIPMEMPTKLIGFGAR